MSIISSVGLGIPAFHFNQTTIKDYIKKVFQNVYGIERLLPIFENAAIENRQFAVSTDWFDKERSFAERNACYTKNALTYSLEAIDQCLSNTNHLRTPIHYNEIDMIIFVSSTGISTPTMDAHIINQRPFRNDIVRLPIWGLGCGGGASALARASEWTNINKDKAVLIICCELCSLTFQQTDHKKRNIVGTALFGDGVAAALIVGEHSLLLDKLTPGKKPLIKKSSTVTKKDTLDIMGWNITQEGLGVIFSKNIPKLVHSFWKNHLTTFLKKLPIKQEEIDSYIAHPGGKKVLQAMEKAFSISSSKLFYSYEILKKHGNMSSPTVLYILKEWMEKQQSHTMNRYSILSALGPGFSSELLLLEWK